MDFTPFFGTLRPFFAWTLRPLTLRPFWPQTRVKKKIGSDGFVPPGGQLLTPMSDRHSIGFLS